MCDPVAGWVLALDTCGATTTLALGRVRLGGLHRGELSVQGEQVLGPRTAASLLLPAVEELLSAHAVAKRELAGLVVVDGPGSFTGIRIGLAAAGGLRLGLGVPVFPVSRLRVLAQGAGVAWAALDAGRGEVFAGHYGPHGEPWEGLLQAAELALRGEQVALCEAKLVAAGLAAKLVEEPTAADALQVALPAMLNGQAAGTLEGRYVRVDLYGPAR